MYFSNMQLHKKIYSINFCMRSKVLRCGVLGCGAMLLIDCNSILRYLMPPAAKVPSKMLVIDYQTTEHHIP